MIKKQRKYFKEDTMNKKKIGNFLVELRKDKDMTQSDVADAFANASIEISENAISSWEKGKTIPDITNLYLLADIYGVSIDELLDGERYKEIDFSKKYFISNVNWMSNYDLNTNLYNIRQEQIIQIVDTFNNLLEKRVISDLHKMRNRNLNSYLSIFIH